MTTRHVLAQGSLLLALVALGGCSGTHQDDRDAAPDSFSPTPGGLCCPVTDFTGCSPGFDPLPAGGWAPHPDQCTRTIDGYDGQPFVRRTDSAGCAVVERDLDAPWCGSVLDAGPQDAGPPPPEDSGVLFCASLSVTECFDNPETCAPAFDDSCCPTCTDGPCADCSHPVYLGCRGRGDGCGSGCATSPAWGCGPAAADCSGATAIDEITCDQIGCVPATEPVGSPALDVECVPINFNSCTVSCRRVAPNCPSGTAPEGDGSCYTDRCIPAWVCAPAP